MMIDVTGHRVDRYVSKLRTNWNIRPLNLIRKSYSNCSNRSISKAMVNREWPITREKAILIRLHCIDWLCG